MVTIAADAMTAEGGIDTLVNGAKKAVDEIEDISIILVGDEILLRQIVDSYERISIYPASRVIGMDIDPKEAVKAKESSVFVSATLVKNGIADVMLSAGNTGASVAAAHANFRRLNKVKRVPIAVTLPTKIRDKYTILLDAGAHEEISPRNLIHYAIMGSTFCKYVMRRKNPLVGLINMGTEKKKGPSHLRKIDEVLNRAEINYAGFIEGGDTRTGKYDVAVFEGFTGNVSLKCMEGSYPTNMEAVVEVITEIDAGIMRVLKEKKFLEKMDARMGYSSQGGGYVLGLRRPLVIAHGSSSEIAIKNAFLFAKKCYDGNLPKMNEEIERKIAPFPILIK